MINIITEKFNGENIYTLIWNGKPCWVAIQIARVLDYDNPSSAISKCVKLESFEIGYEYDVLVGEDLKNFKEIVPEDMKEEIVHYPKLFLFYEQGLYGFLQYTEKPIGTSFRSWIRRDVIPQIREKGFYNLENREIMKLELEELERLKLENKRLKDEIFRVKKEFEQLSIFDFDVDKFQRLKFAYETMKSFKLVLDELTLDNKYKFLFMKKIFNDSGFDLPKYIEEELDL